MKKVECWRVTESDGSWNRNFNDNGTMDKRSCNKHFLELFFNP
jgi:hypothetical protein